MGFGRDKVWISVEVVGAWFWTEPRHGANDRSGVSTLPLQAGNDPHNFVDDPTAFGEVTSGPVVVLDDDNADEAELSKVDETFCDAVELNIREWAMHLHQCRLLVDWIQDGSDHWTRLRRPFIDDNAQRCVGFVNRWRDDDLGSPL